MKSDLVEIAVIVHHETDKALLVDHGETDEHGQPVKVWLPKSQCECDGEVVTMPEWLAKEKGMI